MSKNFMNWKKIWFGLIAIGIPVVLLAQSIKWYNDAAIPQKSTLNGREIVSLQQTGPNAYRWAYVDDLKKYVGASNVTFITTNNVVYGSNYYYNNTYVSNYFETNILNNTVVSNYFFDFIYYTNIYQTNVTVEQYISNDTYVSNTIITNIFNDTYVSNYFETNLFPTTYVYVTNTIGGAFIANLGGMGTNTAFFGGTMFGSQLPNRLLRLDTLGFLDTLPNGTGILTNDGFGGLAWEPLPASSSAQVWTNDGTFVFLSGFNPAPHADLTDITGPPFTFRKDGSLFVGSNVFNDVQTFSGTRLYFPYIYSAVDSNQPSVLDQEFVVTDSQNYSYMADYAMYVEGNSTNGQAIGSYAATLTNGIAHKVAVVADPSSLGSYSGTQIAIITNSVPAFKATGLGNVSASGIYYGDGSGLTNLNVTATTNLTVYETINVKNLNVTSNIYYLNAKATNITWVGPTNTVDFSLGTVQSYVTSGPVSITNVIGEMAAYQNSTILCISNSSANVITNTLTATGWKLGRFDTLVCTNAGVIQIWLQNIGGMKTVAVREYP